MRFYFILLLLSSQLLQAKAIEEKNLKWQTNQGFPLIASQEAIKGSKLVDYIPSFPLTLREVGPDSTGSFRMHLMANQYAFVSLHPNTGEWIPVLATHWALSSDNKSVYYRLDPEAKWSDGEKVKAYDWVFLLEFMRSKKIVAPWYNDYYSQQIESIEALEDENGRQVVKVSLPSPKPDMLYYTNLAPIASHFYKLSDNFIKDYNWKVAPRTGPYQISQINKPNSIHFKKVKNWWGNEKRWFKNRFNIEEIEFRVIREASIAFENLKKGEIDYMSIPYPDYWHEKTDHPLFKKGFIHKLQAYNDMPRSDYLLILNQAFPIFQDIRVRKAFNYAMNVDLVIEKILRRDYARLQGISQGYGDYTNPEIRARTFDLKKANDLLDEAGWSKRNNQGIRIKGSQTLSASISYGLAQHAPRLVVLAQEAKKAGIELKLKQYDASALWNSFLEKRHEIAFVSWNTRYRPVYWGQYHSENANKKQTNNFANIAIKKLDEKIDTYRNSTDEKLRIQLAHEIQKIIHDDASHIPLFEVPYFRLAYWPWLKFPNPPATKESDGLHLFDASSGGLVWIDEKLKSQIKEGSYQANSPVTTIDKSFLKDPSN